MHQYVIHRAQGALFVTGWDGRGEAEQRIGGRRHIYIALYAAMRVCVCVCVCMSKRERERERESKWEKRAGDCRECLDDAVRVTLEYEWLARDVQASGESDTEWNASGNVRRRGRRRWSGTWGCAQVGGLFGSHCRSRTILGSDLAPSMNSSAHTYGYVHVLVSLIKL